MIPRDTIDRIYSAAHIEDVVADYVALKKRGANLIGLCPFHDEKTGSFTVSPSKGIYKCFGCGKSGQTVSFVMEIEQCGYVEALRLLAKRYHIEIEEREQTEEEKQKQDDRESMFVVNEFSNEWFQDQLWNTPEGKAIGLSYFHERGLRDDIIHRFQLGYSPDKSLLSTALKAKGFQEKYILNDSEHEPHMGTGVCCKSEDGRLYDRFHSRVMFPFFSRSGKVVGFAGRIMKQNDKVGKYVNSPTSPLFEKHNELYGFYQAKNHIVRQNHCFLVEGQMDVIAMHQAGIENVVASGGTSLTVPQIRLIHRFTSNLTILYDGDKAGIKAAIRGIDMVLAEGIAVKVVLLPEGEDPDSYTKQHNANEVIEYLDRNAVDFIRFKVQLLKEEASNDPTQRSQLIHSVVQSISVIPDAITRQVYIKDCATLLQMPEQILSKDVAQRRNEGVEARQKQENNRTNITANSETPKPAPMLSRFQRNMLNLLQVIMRHGEEIITINGQNIQVGMAIIQVLSHEDILPKEPLHRLVMDEYMAHCQEDGFKSETYFLQHTNTEIAALAVQLVAEPYQLSQAVHNKQQNKNITSHHFAQEENTNASVPNNDKLAQMVGQMILEIQYTTINEQIDAMQLQLKTAQEHGSWEEIRTLLEQLPKKMEIRAELSKCLGDRILTN